VEFSAGRDSGDTTSGVGGFIKSGVINPRGRGRIKSRKRRREGESPRGSEGKVNITVVTTVYSPQSSAAEKFPLCA